MTSVGWLLPQRECCSGERLPLKRATHNAARIMIATEVTAQICIEESGTKNPLRSMKQE
jgi:hypothetical protein